MRKKHSSERCRLSYRCDCPTSCRIPYLQHPFSNHDVHSSSSCCLVLSYYLQYTHRPILIPHERPMIPVADSPVPDQCGTLCNVSTPRGLGLNIDMPKLESVLRCDLLHKLYQGHRSVRFSALRDKDRSRTRTERWVDRRKTDVTFGIRVLPLRLA